MSGSVRFQHAEIRQSIYTKHIADFIEIYGSDIGKINAEKHAELSARLAMLYEHRKVEKQNKKLARQKLVCR